MFPPTYSASHLLNINKRNAAIIRGVFRGRKHSFLGQYALEDINHVSGRLTGCTFEAVQELLIDKVFCSVKITSSLHASKSCDFINVF
jgi:hypothetical protein